MSVSQRDHDGSGLPSRNLAIVGSAAAGIFAATLGANAFNISTASPHWRVVYSLVIAGWALAVLLVAFVAYIGSGKPSDGQPVTDKQQRLQHGLRIGILLYLAILTAATIGALASASFGSTRDKDNVRLLVSKAEFRSLKMLCDANLAKDHIIGEVRVPSETEQFVIFDFRKTDGLKCTNSVEIPASAILAMQEGP
jgi:hypothetical protein